jgi:NAD(P)-dependent dehydrogenase (short-subunit alcohol dehydrogenase family)
MDIQGKVFIVTGGASGLGEGTARMLAANGGKVVIADMQAEKGEAIAKELGGAFVKCDVSNETDGQAVVAQAVSMGKLVGLVNCAGIAPAEKTVGKNGAHNLAVYTKTIMVNLVGTFNMIRLASEAMCKNEPIARDLSRNGIRNMTIAPGIFGTPMLFGMPQEVQDALAAGVPFPSRLGTPQDYAKLAKHIIENDMLNGEVIRLDGAIRLAPK